MTKQQSFKKAQQSLGYTNKEMAEVLGLGLKELQRTFRAFGYRRGVTGAIPLNTF